MVRLLIGLRSDIVRHSLRTSNRAALIASLLLAAASGAGTLFLGIASYPSAAAGADVIALVTALWLGGRVAMSALSGEPTLRPELFALLPVRRRRLAGALLVVGLADPALALLAVPFAAVIALGAQTSVAAALTGAAGMILLLVLAGVAGTVAAGLLGPGTGRGHDTGTIVTALAIAALSVAGTVLPWLVSALRARSAPWLTWLVRVLPSGWAAVATDAAGRSDWLGAILPLAGLAAVSGLLALAWPRLLTRRMTGAGRPARQARVRAGTRRALLPRTAIGAVAAKEVRLWGRDPVRLTTLLIAVIVGAAACLVPRLTSGTTELFPFAGAGTLVIAGACACNLYGNDGSSLWLTIAAAGSARADVRGRQLGWLLLAGPYAVALTVLLTALAGQGWSWPWVLGLLPALLGGAAGLAPLASLIWVQPLDATGNPTPEWSLKVHAAVIVVALTAAPPVAVGIAGALASLSWLTWLAVPAGMASGTALAWGLGSIAVRRLRAGQVAVLRTLASAARA